MKIEGFQLLLLSSMPLVLGLILWLWNEVRYVIPVKSRSSNSKLPPGHLGLPFIGEILSFTWYFKIVRRPDDFINSKISAYGRNIGMYRTYLFGGPTIIACTPSTCKFVLQSTNEFETAWPAAVVGGNVIITLHGARHQNMKSCIQNYINHPSSLAKVVLHIQPSIISTLESWSQIGKIKAFPEIKKMALGYMAKYLLHCDLGLTTEVLVKLFSGVDQGFRAERWNIYGTTHYHAIQCRKKLMGILKAELHKRKHEDDIATIRTTRTTNDFMDELMQMKDKEGKSFTDEEVLDNVLIIILVSHTSISYALSWSLYFLNKFPHILQKLREENLCMSQKKNGEHITYDDVLELKETLKVVQEILRMANISSFLKRQVTQDVEYQGYIIPKGWNVIVWLRYLHTDSQNFEDPACFNPERWNNPPKHGAYLPFGGGAYACAGNMVSRLNLAIFIHYLCVGYKWELVNPDVPINYLAHPLPTDGVQISISKI